MAFLIECERSGLIHVLAIFAGLNNFLAIALVSLTIRTEIVPYSGNIVLIGAFVVAFIIYGYPGVGNLSAVGINVVLVIVSARDNDGVFCHVSVAV